jgi:hypothetical protein
MCQELGFTGEIGYNQLLYPNEKDTRRLLQFLVQRLPKQEEEKVEVRRERSRARSQCRPVLFLMDAFVLGHLFRSPV